MLQGLSGVAAEPCVCKSVLIGPLSGLREVLSRVARAMGAVVVAPAVIPRRVDEKPLLLSAAISKVRLYFQCTGQLPMLCEGQSVSWYVVVAGGPAVCLGVVCPSPTAAL